MVIEIAFLVFVLFFVALIVSLMGRRGYLGELGKEFSCKIASNEASEMSWTPFIVKQSSKPNNLFVSISTVGVFNDKIVVSYIFPFRLLLPSISISREELSFCSHSKKIGFDFAVVKLKRFPEGEFWFPLRFQSKLDELLTKP
ncbi:hypothetical protein [Amphritea sp. HPY]|uniref:hypothetical protein n=1 Tax=Amphritea sp. HPY TaxID=3421652 RepID=UPI003D7C5A41